MPGLRCSSAATVVPVFAAIAASVSPDTTVYHRTACFGRWPCVFFVVEVTVVDGVFAWCLP